MSNAYVIKEPSALNSLIYKLKYFHRRDKWLTALREEEQQANLDHLRKFGFVKFENFLTQDDLLQIREITKFEIESKCNVELPCLSQSLVDEVRHRNLIDNYFKYHPQELQKFGVTFESKDFNSYDEILNKFSPATLKIEIPRQRVFWKYILHEKITSIIESYMGFKPYLSEAYMRRNFPSKYRVMNHFWHRDTNNKFFILKAFIFLTDCNNDNGPHEYVINSHVDFRLNGRNYYLDDEVDKLYPPNDLRLRYKSIVKAGTLILEDTRGLHRACVPKTSSRDLMYAIFTPMHFRELLKKGLYSLDNATYSSLDQKQKSFIPRNCIR